MKTDNTIPQAGQVWRWNNRTFTLTEFDPNGYRWLAKEHGVDYIVCFAVTDFNNPLLHAGRMELIAQPAAEPTDKAITGLSGWLPKPEPCNFPLGARVQVSIDAPYACAGKQGTVVEVYGPYGSAIGYPPKFRILQIDGDATDVRWKIEVELLLELPRSFICPIHMGAIYGRPTGWCAAGHPEDPKPAPEPKVGDVYRCTRFNAEGFEWMWDGPEQSVCEFCVLVRHADPPAQKKPDHLCTVCGKPVEGTGKLTAPVEHGACHIEKPAVDIMGVPVTVHRLWASLHETGPGIVSKQLPPAREPYVCAVSDEDLLPDL